MSALRTFTAAFITVASAFAAYGCFHAEKPLPPREALAKISERINEIVAEDRDHPQATIAQAAAKAPENPKEILFWFYSNPTFSDLFLGMGNGAKTFSDANPGLSVKAQFIGDWGVAIQKYAVSLAAGDIPDVGVVKRAWLAQLIPSGRITPLDEILPQSFLNGFRRSIRDSLSLGGHLYALPADGFCDVLFYNKSLLAEGPPTTWEELRTCAETLRSKLKHGEFPVGSMPFLEALWSAGGDVCSEAGSGLDNPAALEALEFTLSLRDAKLAHSAFLQDSGAGLRLFLSGDAAMTVASSEFIPEVMTASFPVGVAPVPGKNGPISAFSDNALVVFTQNAQSKRESILALLDFLTRVSARTEGAASVREDIAAVGVNLGVEQAFGVARNTPLTPSWGAIEFELARGLDLAARWRPEK